MQTKLYDMSFEAIWNAFQAFYIVRIIFLTWIFWHTLISLTYCTAATKKLSMLGIPRHIFFRIVTSRNYSIDDYKKSIHQEKKILVTQSWSIIFATKGQVISKANFKVFIWTKKPMKLFLYFCLRLRKPLKSGQNKR